ncbi:hydroxyacylglutathione hydrolase [Parashewanella tropica]|uniref:hydroxyacylglutathione hydrolase n=1 Tax=Parashewanella tropica TaxID=2547970 RepID=UPI00105A0E5D|nr:hydroxyacylglutathione hydrolase [Parashewanella tropica]
MLSIQPIPAFNDNYIWCISNQEKQALIVDPGSAKEVIDYLTQQQLTLKGILITHHHADHIGGVNEILNTLGEEIPVYGPKSNRIPQVTHFVDDTSPLVINELGIEAQIITLTGHTLEHIAYLIEGNLFCGDTLFSGGCGRIFEGTPEQMFESLNKLKDLPPTTKIFCAHEYTLSNLKFALAAEPNNRALQAYHAKVERQRKLNQITLPSTIENELKINPFFRCGQSEIQSNLRAAFELPSSLPVVDYFTHLRKWKDVF